MVWRIEKVNSDGIDYLPDVLDTPLWDFINPDQSGPPSKHGRQIALLYDAICKRENHYQENTPPAFGDPEYRYYEGVVHGILLAMHAEESLTDEKIVIRSAQSGRKILVVDKVKRPQSYYDSVKDNRETLRAIGW